MERQPINMLNSVNGTETHETGRLKRKSIFFLFLVFGTLLAGASLAISVLKSPETNNQNTLQPKHMNFFQTVKNFIFKPDNILEGQTEDRVNILLLGIGGQGHDGPYLSDTNIIVSIKPSTNEVALVSIPRDLGVKVNGHGWRKINSANAFGEAENPGHGGDYARRVFEETFNIEIPYYIRVDFKAFEEIIDEVGGVTVDVPRAFVDNSYPGPNFSYVTIKFDAGTQTMSGERALIFARSRHGNNGEGSDFARARRQQLILEALKAKMLSLGTYANPATLQGMYSSLNNHISTNLNIAELAYLASLAKDVQNTKNLVIDNSPGGFLVSTTGESGAFILSPKTGNFDTINQAIGNVFEDSPTSTPTNHEPTPSSSTSVVKETVNTFKIEVQNGTWIPGLAARIEKKLEEKGFNVIGVGNSLKRPISNTVIYTLSSIVDKNSLSELSKTLEAANTSTLPDWLLESYDSPTTSEDESGMKYNKEADILIILGTDTKE